MSDEQVKQNTPETAEEYTLESILAEYGPGAAKPAPRTRDLTARKEAAPREAPSRLAGAAPKKETLEKETPKKSPDRRREDTAADDRETAELPDLKDIAHQEAPRQEAPLRETPRKPEPEKNPEPEDNTPPDRVSIRSVMHDTVDQVLAENEDGILPTPPTLRERLGSLTVRRRRQHRVPRDTERLWDEVTERLPAEEVPAPEEPEPDSEEAARTEKRRCRRLRRRLMLSAVPALVLAALSVLEQTEYLPSQWWSDHLLRSGTLGVLLLLTMLFCTDVFRGAVEGLRNHRMRVETAVTVSALVALGNCVCSALAGDQGNEPFAVSAAVMLWLCQCGLWQTSRARREAFYLADKGGCPPYVLSVTESGGCRQRGRLEGFYRLWEQEDTVRTQILPGLLLSAATLAAGVVVVRYRCTDRFLWVWSAMLCAVIPLSLPLQISLPLARLQHRLSRNGTALAGLAGAKQIARCRRVVVAEADLFPPGTVAFNGYKVFGEERIKMLTYAATVAHAAGSQLDGLFAQQLTAEGGFRTQISELQFHEEGGVSAMIRGETVLMGSAYFMRKKHVSLPADLKLQTGVFLAVDGVLGAIFVIKYQPSRNVEWALRAMKRAHMPPVLAVRSGNVTPGLLRRKFGVDCKPIYPDVSTRLALSDVMEQRGEKANALIYREGLLPPTETVIGARRLLRAVRWATALGCVGAAAGLALTWYFTSVTSFTTLTPLYMLVYGLLWLLPTLLLSGSIKHF